MKKSLYPQIQQVCNDSKNCVEHVFCAEKFESESSIVSCGPKKVCCDKYFDTKTVKLPTCGMLKFDVPKRSLKLPWSVSIEENTKQICTGTLINPQVVMTTGQCLSGKQPNEFKIKLGFWGVGHNFIIKESRDVEKIVLHPNFVHGKTNDDLALIVLKTPSPDNAYIGPICLANSEQTFNGKSCVLLGFEENPAYKSNVEDLKVTSCSEFPEIVASARSICTEKNSGMTMNSMGAGLVCETDDKLSYQLAGVFQHGSDSRPSVFVNVADYRTWIDNIMTDLKFGSKSYTYDPTACRYFDFGGFGNWQLTYQNVGKNHKSFQWTFDDNNGNKGFSSFNSYSYSYP